MDDNAVALRRVKVNMLMWWLPHFRAPIFRQLSQNPHIDFTVCTGDNSRVYGGESVSSASEVGNIEGINWHKLSARRLKGPLFRDFEWQPGAIKIAWNDDYDVQIIHGVQSLSNWLVRAICRLRGIPLIEWSHGITRPEGRLKWVVKKAYMKLANAYLFYGNFARDFFASHGFKDEELFVVYNSLDHDKQVAIREQI
ncbi:MAG TPA: glycosyltransferase, partial [Phycisphaerae bacterium]|nr:glycosyltransferase [Phycisphaerae bacterium]